MNEYHLFLVKKKIHEIIILNMTTFLK